MKRLARILFFAAAAICFGAPPGVSSQTYPAKPIRVVVPNPPGGATDLVARRFADKIRAAFNQPIIIDNRGGGGGTIAAEAVAKAAADGYTLLFGTGTTHGTNVVVYKKLPYDPVNDFAPISLLARPHFGLFVPAASPVKTVADLVALARRQPGKLNYGSYGIGTTTHLMTEQFKAAAGIDLAHIPYKGSVAAQLGAINNDVQMIFDGVGNASAHVASGKLRMVGIASTNRTPVSPQTPTLSESGVPFVYESSFMGFFAPAGTARNIVMALNRELVNATKQPDVRDWLTGQAYEIVGSSPEELARNVSGQIEMWRKLVREKNLKFEE